MVSFHSTHHDCCGVDEDVTEPTPCAVVAVARGNRQEAMMKLLITTTIALSFVTAASAVAGVNPSASRASMESAAPPAQSSPVQLAGRRGKCSENLGYGRTGSYGCG